VRRAVAILCVAALCALAAGGSVASAQPSPTIASGVYIGSVAVGGMTGAQATTAVKAAYLAPLVVRVKHHSYTVKTWRFRVVANAAAVVQTALAAPQNTTVPLTPTYSMARLTKWVKTLAAQVYRPADTGTIVLRGARPRFLHSHPGRKLQKFGTRILLRDAILQGDHTPIKAPLGVISAASATSEPIIVIHRGENRLVLFRGTHLVRTFPVATGQAIYPTPLGKFQIVVKEKNPWWYPPTQDAWARGLKPVPPGPGNPLGTRWMGLSAPGVGIHGTDEPWSIGHSESHGCIRMQVPDAEWLYNQVRVGTPVFIVYN